MWFSFNGTSGVLLADENISFPMPFTEAEAALSAGKLLLRLFWQPCTC